MEQYYFNNSIIPLTWMHRDIPGMPRDSTEFTEKHLIVRVEPVIKLVSIKSQTPWHNSPTQLSIHWYPSTKLQFHCCKSLITVRLQFYNRLLYLGEFSLDHYHCEFTMDNSWESGSYILKKTKRTRQHGKIRQNNKINYVLKKSTIMIVMAYLVNA